MNLGARLTRRGKECIAIAPREDAFFHAGSFERCDTGFHAVSRWRQLNCGLQGQKRGGGLKLRLLAMLHLRTCVFGFYVGI